MHGVAMRSHIVQVNFSLRLAQDGPRTLCACHTARIRNASLSRLQGHTAKDFLRRLKAKYVHSSQAQEDGAEDPGAFAWGSMGADVADMFRGAPGVFCMVRSATGMS
jgi:hypothetical protein